MPKSVVYSQRSKGRWFRTEWAEQCPEKVFLLREKCQGVKGHKGVHWAFSASGSFEWHDNKHDPKEDGCSGSIPPDHKKYRTPQSMQKHHFLSHHTTTKVTDPKVIAKLEAGKYPEKGCSIDRPVSAEDFKKLKDKI